MAPETSSPPGLCLSMHLDSPCLDRCACALVGPGIPSLQSPLKFSVIKPTALFWDLGGLTHAFLLLRVLNMTTATSGRWGSLGGHDREGIIVGEMVMVQTEGPQTTKRRGGCGQILGKRHRNAPSSSHSMANLRCIGCKDLFNSQKAKNQHIGASPSCLDVYDRESYLHSTRPVQPSPAPVLSHPAELSPPPPSGPLLFWPDAEQDQPSPPCISHEETPAKRRRVTIEEVDEEDDRSWTYKKFPRPVTTTQGKGVTVFSDLLAEQRSMGEDPYSPFRDHKEWGLAKWLMRQTTQKGADEYLKLEIVSTTSCIQIG